MKKFKTFFYSILLVSLLLTPIITSSTNYAQAETSERIHFLDQYRVGCKCCDGWDSKATGRGACSHHGGVQYWIIYDDETGKYYKDYTGRCD